MSRAGITNETYNSDGILAGDFPLRGDVVTIASSAALVKGAVLGRITATGKYLLSASAASDGSQTPIAILAEDADASGGDVTAVVYHAGDFVAEKLTLGAGHTIDSVKASLLGKTIFIHNRSPL